VAGLNAASFAGHNDWRLPNVKELQSIVNYQNGNPALSSAFNNGCTPGCTVLTCNCTLYESGVYWSSTTYVAAPQDALDLYPNFGQVGATGKTDAHFVRAVRGGSSCLPATGQTTCWDSSGTVIPCAGTGQDGDIQAGGPLSYTDNGDGTITDNNTGLVWEKLSSDGSIHDQNMTYVWDNAFAVHVAALNTANFAGHNDWRLPNVKELQSIVDYQNINPAVSSAFNNGCTPGCTACSCTFNSIYWSSTSYATRAQRAWSLHINFGQVADDSKGNAFFVRAVRAGS